MRPSMWLPRRVLVPLLAALGAVLAWTGAGTASQPLYDANVQFASLKVNGKGEALVTYRRNNGRLRHVLVWGALNAREPTEDRKSTRLNSSHEWISYAVFCLKKTR